MDWWICTSVDPGEQNNGPSHCCVHLFDIGDNGRLHYWRFCLFEVYVIVSVVFVIRCLYSSVSLTLVREQSFMRIIIIIIIIISALAWNSESQRKQFSAARLLTSL